MEARALQSRTHQLQGADRQVVALAETDDAEPESISSLAVPLAVVAGSLGGAGDRGAKAQGGHARHGVRQPAALGVGVVLRGGQRQHRVQAPTVADRTHHLLAIPSEARPTGGGRGRRGCRCPRPACRPLVQRKDSRLTECVAGVPGRHSAHEPPDPPDGIDSGVDAARSEVGAQSKEGGVGWGGEGVRQGHATHV